MFDKTEDHFFELKYNYHLSFSDLKKKLNGVNEEDHDTLVSLRCHFRLNYMAPA
jgi:galactose mutarotase-like enzyme